MAECPVEGEEIGTHKLRGMVIWGPCWKVVIYGTKRGASGEAKVSTNLPSPWQIPGAVNHSGSNRQEAEKEMV